MLKAAVLLAVFTLLNTGILSQRCPARSANPGRQCKKACTRDSQCRGGLKRCRCDNICGMSCFNPNLVCRDPEAFPNGQITGERTYGQTITYSCDVGYNLKLNRQRTCQSDKGWSGVQPRCDPGCTAPPRTETAFIDSSEVYYDLNAIATYVCRTGFRLSGSPTVRCGDGGVWSSVRFTCNRKNCGEPPRLTNGHFTGDDFTFGGRVYYFCNIGYTRSSRQNRLICDSTERWYGVVPTCAIVTCGEPERPEHGSVHTAGVRFEYRGRVTYSCEAGYRIDGPLFRYCNENGTWGETPRCVVDKDCNFETPTRPTCGYQNLGTGWNRVISHNVAIGSVGFVAQATFPRSWARGNSRLLSLALNRDSPLCVKFYYYIRHLPSNHTFTVNGVDSADRRTPLWAANVLDGKNRWQNTDILLQPDVGSIQIEFKVSQSRTSAVSVDLDEITIDTNVACVDECATQPCQNGGFCFNRINSFSCVCTRGFRGADCSEEITCDTLAAPRHGTRSHATARVRLDTVVTFGCDQGYYMRGERRTICSDGNRWTSPTPTCHIMTCVDRRVPESTKVPNKNSWVYGDSVTFTCNRGYRMTGVATSTCQSNNRPTGVWSQAKPSCVRMKCVRRNVANARSSPNFRRYDFGSTVQYTCIDGYRLVGERDVRCVGENTWSADSPVCERMKCTGRNVANARSSPNFGRYDFGSTVRYTCAGGYRLVGQRDVRCVGENTWSADPPVCQRMKCLQRNVANARSSPNFGRHDFGSTVRYTCIDGYRLVGQHDVRCVGENTWSADPPVCERIQCQIRAVANARTLPEGQSVWYSGDNVTYECFVGYLMVGGALSTCRDDTTWSTPKPVCLKNHCSNRDLFNGEVVPANVQMWAIGSNASYFCDEGFRLEGHSVASCEQGGEWSVDLPSCSGTSCNKTDVPNSIIVPNKDVFQPGEYVAYSCLPGYTLTGQNSTRCLPNGQWTGFRPECRRVRCPDLVVNNGGVSPVTHVWEFGDAATITCDDGHRLAGSGQVINCQANGEWDGAPTCEAITCPDRNVANAVKSLNQVIWHVNDVVSFVCGEGYRLEGQAASTCLENGQWSASLPQCVERDGWRDWSTWSRCNTSCVKTFEIRQRVCLQAGRCPGQDIEHRPCRSSSTNFRGKTYTVVEMRRNFNGARRFCRSQGGDLATMKNADVRNHLYDVIRGYSNAYRNQFFFGLYRTQIRNWQWVDNTAAGDRHNGRYHSWKGVEPNNALKNEFCGSFFTWNGGWNDIPCDVCLFFICEKDVECPRPNTPDGLSVNAPLSIASFPVGSRLEFRCISANERLVGERSVTCLADGSWNHPTPECVKRCPRPQAPLSLRHVDALQNFHEIGDALSYVCSHANDRMEGSGHIVCQDSGAWTGFPNCVKRCNPPPLNDGIEIINLFAIYEVGFTVNFRCVAANEDVVGTNPIRCRADRSWSHNTPSCVRRCIGPVLPSGVALSNGGNVAAEYRSGHILRFRCSDRNDVLQGQSTLTCQEDGTWNHQVPICVKQCSQPILPHNSGLTRQDQGVVGGIYFVGSSVTFGCRHGNDLLVGDQIIRCLVGGVWDGLVPSCEKRCESLVLPSSVHISAGESHTGFYNVDQQINFACIDQRDRLDGSTASLCRRDRTWSHFAPNCVTRCTAPDVPAHARVARGGQLSAHYNVGQQVQFECSEMTAEMVGSATVSCTDSRSWSQSPQCNQKCLPILEISHGSVEYRRTNRIVTHTIFTCDRGYEIVGSSILRCLPSNQWSHEIPVCQELDPCVSTPCQHNGECRKVDGISYTCTCQQNYRGDNCETIINPCFNNPCQNGGTCTQNGQDYQCTCQGRFEGPNCENVKRCPDMNLSPGVRTTPGSSFTVGGSARFQCSDTNKVLSGNQELNCLSDQTWDRSPPTCVVPAGMCPELLAPLNGNLILRAGTSRNVGATYRYRCNEGYNLKGASSYIVCLDDHTWSVAESERPRCIVPGCTIFLLPSGVSLPQGEHPVGRQLTVACSGNQVLRGGPPGIVCRGRNNWSTPISSYSCSPQ